MNPEDERPNPTPKDIPDMTSRKRTQVVLEPEVQLEREVRVFIKKDGVFRKDLKSLSLIDTGRTDDKGNPIREAKYSDRQAEQIARETCERSGRIIKTDPETGRPMAVPGWNMDIRVPGFEQSEQKATPEKTTAVRERLMNKTVLELKEQNEQLQQRLADLEAKNQPAKNGEGEASSLKEAAAGSPQTKPAAQPNRAASSGAKKAQTQRSR